MRPDTIAKLIMFSLVAAIWFAAYKVERFRYKDCLHVGHSKTYCLLDIGR